MKDYQLWVKLGNDESPYPLIGEYIIFMLAVGADIDTLLDWLQSLNQFFHQCVISYSCSQSNSDGSVLSLKQSHQS